MHQFVSKGALMDLLILLKTEHLGGGGECKKSTNQTTGVCPAMPIQFKYANVGGGETVRENKKGVRPNKNQHLTLFSLQLGI